MGSLQTESMGAIHTFSSALEERVAKQPDAPFAYIPKSKRPDDGFDAVTYLAVSDAVNAMAWWIEGVFGASDNGETITYLGPGDLRYAVFVIASIKAGYKILLPSLRNSLEGQLSLLKQTQCEKILFAKEVYSSIKNVQEAIPSSNFAQVPSLQDVFDSKNGEKYTSKGLQEQINSPIIILHTSGTTGLPKPVYLTNGAILTVIQMPDLLPPKGRIALFGEYFESGRSIFSMMPFFHMMGLITIIRAVFHAAPVILPPTDAPIDVDLVMDILRVTRPWACKLSPSILEQMYQRDDFEEVLGHVEVVYFGGAPLAPAAGDRLNEVTRTVNIIGTTEVGTTHMLIPESKSDWVYFQWMAESGIIMEPVADNIFEWTIKPDAAARPLFLTHTFPEVEQWETKDLFQPHPTKAGLWRHIGRKDDVIVLSNGEKFIPVDFEKRLESHPQIRGALVVGTGRFQASLLIEPDWSFLKEGSKAMEQFILDIWLIIKEANKTLPAHAQIWQSKIALAKPEMPFKKSPKGNIVRKLTEQLYEKEIDALYMDHHLEKSQDLRPDGMTDDVWYKHAVILAFKSVLPELHEDLDDNTSIFTVGADSLQVLGIASSLNQMIRPGREARILPSAIYKHSSINTLTAYLCNRDQNHEIQDKKILIEDLIKKYSIKKTAHTVLLTGSTGSLGRYILHELLLSDKISKIYCLNRSEDAQDRQIVLHTKHNLHTDFSKATFLHADLAAPKLGLSDPAYSSLVSETTLILHNAWPVNFNLPLQTFTPQLQGLQNLTTLSLSLSPSSHIPITFISSISSVASWPLSHKGPIPEAIFDEPSLPLKGQGYAESKYISEHILANSAKDAGASAKILRVGQIAGPEEGGGGWNEKEWIPSLVKTSLKMGVTPESLGAQDPVAWAPVDGTARAVVEIALSPCSKTTKTEAEVSHILNPNPIPWSQLLPAIQGPTPVPLREWVAKLKSINLDVEKVEDYPAAKLVDFFEGLIEDGTKLEFEIKKTLERSQAMRDMKPITGEMMRSWFE